MPTRNTQRSISVTCNLQSSRMGARRRGARSDKSQLLCADKQAVVTTDAFTPRRYNAHIPVGNELRYAQTCSERRVRLREAPRQATWGVIQGYTECRVKPQWRFKKGSAKKNHHAINQQLIKKNFDKLCI